MRDNMLYAELDALPTLAKGQSEELKIDTDELDLAIDDSESDGLRVWIEPSVRGEISAERRRGGKWWPGTSGDVRVAVAAARIGGLL